MPQLKLDTALLAKDQNHIPQTFNVQSIELLTEINKLVLDQINFDR